MHLPTVVFLAPAAVCVLSWAGLGLAVPRRLLGGELLLDSLTRLGCGSLVASLLLLALGRVGLFDRWLLVALTVVAAIPGAYRFLRGRRPAVPRGTTRVLAVATAVALAVDLVAATAPPTSAD